MMEGIFLRRRGHFLRNHWFALILVWLLFFERLLMLSHLGAEYTLGSDDLSYVKAGITFYRTGAITMHGVISAQIMPGLPVLISAFVALFGTGHRLWIALKMFWCLLGSLAAWFTYLAIDEKAPKFAAILPMFLYFTPDFAWQDNLILTETPFMFLTCLYIYGLFRLGNRQDWASFFIVFGSAFLAFMLKAQALVFFLMPLPYLWAKKYPSGRLYLQSFISFLLLAAFIVPWSVRNYYHFGDFIPTTYGIGNPLLLGTYQGEGYPSDEEVFNQEEIDEELLKTYRRFGESFDEYTPKHLRYVYMKSDELKAKERMRYWWRHDRESMLKSYLYLKPKKMLFETFYWDEVVPGTKTYIEFSRRVDFVLAMLAIPATIAAKRYIAEASFVVIAYWIQVYMYAYAYVFDRYAQTLLPFRYIAIGFFLASCYHLYERFSRRMRYRQVMNAE